MRQTSPCSRPLVRGLLAEVAPDRADDLARIDPNGDLWAALDLDSLDHLTVMTRLAEELGVDIAEHDYPRLISLRQLEEFVDGHRRPDGTFGSDHPPPRDVQ